MLLTAENLKKIMSEVPYMDQGDKDFAKTLPDMPLKDWMREVGHTAPSLARQLGVNQQSVYGWVAGRHSPALRHVHALTVYSRGRITAASFLQIEDE